MYVSKVYQYAVDAYGDVRTLVRGITFQWHTGTSPCDRDKGSIMREEFHVER